MINHDHRQARRGSLGMILPEISRRFSLDSIKAVRRPTLIMPMLVRRPTLFMRGVAAPTEDQVPSHRRNSLAGLRVIADATSHNDVEDGSLMFHVKAREGLRSSAFSNLLLRSSQLCNSQRVESMIPAGHTDAGSRSLLGPEASDQQHLPDHLDLTIEMVRKQVPVSLTTSSPKILARPSAVGPGRRSTRQMWYVVHF